MADVSKISTWEAGRTDKGNGCCLWTSYLGHRLEIVGANLLPRGKGEGPDYLAYMDGRKVGEGNTKRELLNLLKKTAEADQKCQRHLVRPYHCQRKASVCRVTSSNKEVWLCKKCDESFGNIVGEKKEG